MKGDAAILGRVEGVFPAEGESMVREWSGGEVEILNLHHGRGGRPEIESLGFLVEMGGLTWLHVGDTEATTVDIRPYSLAERSVDVALLPVWFLDYDEFIHATREAIAAHHLVVMHLATETAPPGYSGRHGSRAERLDSVRELFPDIVILETAGDSVVFAESDSP